MWACCAVLVRNGLVCTALLYAVLFTLCLGYTSSFSSAAAS